MKGFKSIIAHLLSTRLAYCDQDGKLTTDQVPSAIPVNKDELQALLDLAAGLPVFGNLSEIDEVEVEENERSTRSNRYALKFKEELWGGCEYLIEDQLYPDQAAVLAALVNTLVKLAK